MLGQLTPVRVPNSLMKAQITAKFGSAVQGSLGSLMMPSGGFSTAAILDQFLIFNQHISLGEILGKNGCDPATFGSFFCLENLCFCLILEAAGAWPDAEQKSVEQTKSN